MNRRRRSVFPELNWLSLEHAARTAIAAVVSLLAARTLGLPEAYWAPITTLVVMQSTLGAALKVSGQRFAGTALGAVTGALLAPLPHPLMVFGLAVFALGLVAVILHLGRAAYRFAGITLTIVLLVKRTESAWLIATHRFVEVSLGIAVGLALTAIWPERETTKAAPRPQPGPGT
jgi:uncharacterized membrane protein YccC